MFRKVLVIVAAAAISVFYLSGCKKSPEESKPEKKTPKTLADYEAEAKKEITQENMAEELGKLEKKIEAETP